MLGRSQISRRFLIFFSFLHFCLKIGLKVYAIFRELLYHLSSIVIHQTKPTTYDSHHPKWFQDRFIYNKDKWGVKKIVNPETPCTMCFPSCYVMFYVRRSILVVPNCTSHVLRGVAHLHDVQLCGFVIAFPTQSTHLRSLTVNLRT